MKSNNITSKHLHVSTHAAKLAAKTHLTVHQKYQLKSIQVCRRNAINNSSSTNVLLQ